MPRTEYIFKNPENVVRDMLAGMKAAYPGLYVDPEDKFVMLNRNRKNRVGLICGACAGIEPFGAGFVGEGMLTAYLYGEIFHPPEVKVISQVIHNVAMLNQGGVLILLLNYPRQMLNFGLAIEKARLKGITVESFVVTDDCARTGDTELVALERNLSLRIGLTGSAYVFKILGTMSTLGYSLWEILDQAMQLNFRLATIGFKSKLGTPIGYMDTKPTYKVPEGDVVVGSGLIIDDTGVRSIKKQSTRGIVQEIMPKAVEKCGLEEKKCSSCCVLVNNLGSMTQMELFAIANEVDLFLGELEISIDRLYVGTLMTTLNTKGALISLLNTTNCQQWLPYLDACTESFSWPGCRLSKVNMKIAYKEFKEEEEESGPKTFGMILSPEEASIFQKCVINACEEIIKSEDVINRLNAITGNGDCGTNMRQFAEILKEKANDMSCEDVSATFGTVSKLASEKMTGTIGCLYSIGLESAAENADCWANIWESANSRIEKISGAKIGDRTLLDVLIPSFHMFGSKMISYGESQWKHALKAAVDCAECWCFKTSQMTPGAGRARYIPAGLISNMDAGAYGVLVWLKSVYQTLLDESKRLIEKSFLEK